jgi:hypothetical protein
MKLQVVSLSRKTSELSFNCGLSASGILYTDCIDDLGVLLDSEVYFYHHGDPNLFSYPLKLVGLIQIITCCSSLSSLLMQYISLVITKLEYSSVVWNFLTNTDSSKLERIQEKFLCDGFCKYHNAQV